MQYIKKRLPFHSRKSLKGFTLVELSIVIVIVALIIAGVSAGRGLIAAARINAQVSDLQMYSTAFNAFRGQYNAMAGDMKNASSYWPGVTNGNGNGMYETYAFAALPDLTKEHFTLFQHLAAAKLIPGSYNNTYVLDIGYPSLKIDKRKGMIAGNQIYFTSVNPNWQLTAPEITQIYKAILFLTVSTPSAGNGASATQAVMTPKAAFAIDTKIDDGKPRRGKFMAFSYWSSVNGGCLFGSLGVAAAYNISLDYPSCHGEYILKP